MIIDFELALAKEYIKYLVPGVKEVKLSSDEESFYWDERFNQYPSVLVYRDDAEPDFCARYAVQDDTTLEVHTLFPYIQPYVIRVFVEKQAEAVAVRNEMRLKHFKNPYVEFLHGETPFRTGLRLLRLGIETKRSNRDAKGAQRIVSMLVQSNLVLTDTQGVPEIQEVHVKLKDKAKKPPLMDRIFRRNTL